MSIFICEVLFCTVHVYVRHIWSSSILYRVLDIFKIKLRKHTKFLSTCVSFVSLASFRIPRRKSGIRGNQSTAIVPVLGWPPEQFAVLQYIGRERSRVCLPGWAGGRRRALIGWLHRSVLSLHRTLIWPSTVAYFSGTGEFSELRRPPAEISVLSFLRRACENSLLCSWVALALSKVIQWKLSITRPLGYIVIQWNLVITRSLGPWKLPCYIGFLISG